VKDFNDDKAAAALMPPPASPSKSSSGGTKAQKKKKMNLAEALKEEEHRLLEADRMLAMDERKRPYIILSYSMIENQAPSEVEMDAYRMKRKRDDDPMAHFM
jgi:pre-mRNA-processing factor SLU7